MLARSVAKRQAESSGKQPEGFRIPRDFGPISLHMNALNIIETNSKRLFKVRANIKKKKHQNSKTTRTDDAFWKPKKVLKTLHLQHPKLAEPLGKYLDSPNVPTKKRSRPYGT